MATKKLIIPRESLPNPTDTLFHVRYRVVSEDKNRFSPWTPIFSVTSEYVYIQQSTGFASDILSNQVFS